MLCDLSKGLASNVQWLESDGNQREFRGTAGCGRNRGLLARVAVPRVFPIVDLASFSLRPTLSRRESRLHG
jgi:hypothetical protein